VHCDIQFRILYGFAFLNFIIEKVLEIEVDLISFSIRVIR